MELKIPKNSKLRNSIGTPGADFLAYGMDAIERILPHLEIPKWEIKNSFQKSGVTWVDPHRKKLKISLGIPTDDTHTKGFTITGIVQRRKIPGGVGKVARTLDLRERNVCEKILLRLNEILHSNHTNDTQTLSSLHSSFDEQVVATHLKDHHHLELNLADLFSALRNLAEQSYENKALTFGCLIDCKDKSKVPKGGAFPHDFFERKKFRLFSDGYRTAYKLSAKGGVKGFSALTDGRQKNLGSSYFPEWSRYLASLCTESTIGISLTRQGDILIIEAGTVRFTYRLGKWQYWNHAHLVDLLQNAARAQRVPPSKIPKVARAMYRSALDVSFRRSGGLFVLLRNNKKLHPLVHRGDAVRDKQRRDVEKLFDKALPSQNIQALSRSIITELTAVDGAIVLNNKGEILAYGAVLEPRKRGRISREEGSRTKAAIGASYDGLAIKISSDGDITVYTKGEMLIKV
jgi:hypothetical protein